MPATGGGGAAAAGGGRSIPAATRTREGVLEQQQQPVEEKIRSQKEQAAEPWSCGGSGWHARGGGGGQGRALVRQIRFWVHGGNWELDLIFMDETRQAILKKYDRWGHFLVERLKNLD